MGRMGLAIDGERLAWLALALVEPLAPRSAFALVERFGSPGAVLNAGESSLRAAGLSATIIAALGAVRPEREISVLARVDATLVTWPDGEYPVRLRHIADAPLALAGPGALVPLSSPQPADQGPRARHGRGRGGGGERLAHHGALRPRAEPGRVRGARGGGCGGPSGSASFDPRGRNARDVCGGDPGGGGAGADRAAGTRASDGGGGGAHAS